MQLLGRQIIRQFHGAVVLVDLDRADQAAGQLGFVGDGAHDVARLHTVVVTDLNAVTTHGLVVATLGATRATAVITTIGAAFATLTGFTRLARFLHELGFFQDQRLAVEHGRCQRHSHVFAGQVHAVHELFHQRTGFVDVAILQAGGQLLLEARDTLGVQVIHGRQRHFLDALTGYTLDLAQHVLLTAADEQNRIAFTAGTTGTADTVHVGFRVAGHVVINHMGDARHVQTPGDHIGGDQQVETLVFQTLYGFFTLLLLHVAIQGVGAQVATVELFCQLKGRLLGAHEYDHGIVVFRFQNTAQGVQLVEAGHRPETLANGGRGGRGTAVDLYFLRVFQVLVSNLANHRRHGGGEQGQLAVRRSALEYPLHVINKAHAQHFVGFIQHQGFQVVQFQGAAFHVIHDAAGGADNHLGAATQAFQLGAVFTATVNGQHLQAFDIGSKFFTGSGDLDSQFAGGSQDQHLRFTQVGVQAGKQGQGEGSGFTGTCLGLTQQIVAIEQQRDGLRLNRRRLFEALTGDRREQYLG